MLEKLINALLGKDSNTSSTKTKKKPAKVAKKKVAKKK
jgi:hypothetical protein